MKIKITQKGTSLSTIAEDRQEANPEKLRTHHNLHCENNQLIDSVDQELKIGAEVILPDEEVTDLDAQYAAYNPPVLSEDADDNTLDEEENEDSDSSGRNKSSHEGKYYVIQRGTCECNQGFKPAKFKVTSHQHHYWNDLNGAKEANCLAMTEEDTQLEPSSETFGKCKLRPRYNDFQPCIYAPAGNWEKTFMDVKIMGKNTVTEISELMCTTGGKITVVSHGQQSEVGQGNVNNTNTMEQQALNPMVDYDEFKAELDEEEFEVR